MTPEFVLGYRAMMLDGITREAEITKKVIAAVPDAKVQLQARSQRPYRQGTGVASGQYRCSVSGRHCRPAVQHGARPRTSRQTSAEVVAWYDENMKRGIARVEAMSAEQLLTPVEFLRRVQSAGRFLSWIPQQPQHPSPRRAGDVPAAHGIEGALDLRRQLR